MRILMLKNIRKYDDNDNDNDDDDDDDDMENLPEIRISLAPAPFPPDRRRLLWSAAPPNRLKSMIGRRDQKIRLKLEEMEALVNKMQKTPWKFKQKVKYLEVIQPQQIIQICILWLCIAI